MKFFKSQLKLVGIGDLVHTNVEQIVDIQAVYVQLLLMSYEFSSGNRTHPTGREFPHHTLISFSCLSSSTNTYLYKYKTTCPKRRATA